MLFLGGVSLVLKYLERPDDSTSIRLSQSLPDDRASDQFGSPFPPPLPQVAGCTRDITVNTQSPVENEKAESTMLKVHKFKIDESQRTKMDKGGELDGPEAEILVTKQRKKCKKCKPAVLFIFSNSPCCSDPAHL